MDERKEKKREEKKKRIGTLFSSFLSSIILISGKY